MKKIEAYITDDGKIHQFLDEAERHDLALMQRQTIDEFLDSADNPYKSFAHRSVARQSILNWEFWKKNHAK